MSELGLLAEIVVQIDRQHHWGLAMDMVLWLVCGAALMALAVWLLSRRKRPVPNGRDASDDNFAPLYGASGSGGRKSADNGDRAERSESSGDSDGGGGGGD